MPLVAGIDSSTQACKVVIRDAETGRRVRSGRAPHPPGTEVDPEHWWVALKAATKAAGGFDDVDAVSVGGQQHGMVCLDTDGQVVRPALLWNDTRSARASADLIAELGGPGEWAKAVGSVPLAAFTITKLRWLAEHEPDNARRTEAVCLPHDWLTWRLAGTPGLDELVTDRGDASGTGYWSPATGEYRTDLVAKAFGRSLRVPRVLGPLERVAANSARFVLGAGSGDNAAAALGLGAAPGDLIVSVGTSGVVCSRSASPTADPAGAVAGFASATGDFLPLVCTLNAARVLDASAELLRVSHRELSELALSVGDGADGVVMIPYFEGERTPNRPTARGSLHGLTLATTTPAHVARAAVEGLLCGLADGIDALIAERDGRVGDAGSDQVLLIGGGAQSAAVCRIAPTIFGRPVVVPEPGEYVADGAARQAAWALAESAAPPSWELESPKRYEGAGGAESAGSTVRDRYAQFRDQLAGFA